MLSATIRWAPVVGFEGYFEVSEAGAVRSVSTGLARKTFQRKSGHVAIYLTSPKAKRCLMVHAMVLEAFVSPRPAGHVARHRNGVAWDNHKNNLQWGTPLDNSADAREHGTTIAGVRNPQSKLTRDQVLAIRSSTNQGTALAVMYGVRPETISNIRTRRTWQHV